MLLSPRALTVAKLYELTQQQTQAILDAEVQAADLGLKLWLICRDCVSIGDHANCEGDAQSHPDGTMTFSVICGCTKRAFRGTFRAPGVPREPRQPRADTSVKLAVTLPRKAVQRFEDLDAMCRQLKLSHYFRCMACKLEDMKTDGVWGASESNANQFVLECACTRRVYKGADVKLVH
jgi:hypothetical protein